MSICALLAHELLTKARLILTSTQPDRRNAIACIQPNRTISTILHEVISLQVRLLRDLPLNLVHEVKVWLVEVVHAHVTVLSSTAVSGSLGVHGDVVERTEVTTYTANLLGKDLVVETRFELTLAGRGGCNIHGGLTSAKDNVVFYRSNGSAVEGSVGNIRFQDIKCLGIDELGALVIKK